jgi:hypothetical protein
MWLILKRGEPLSICFFNRIHEEIEKTSGKNHLASAAMEVSMKKEG